MKLKKLSILAGAVAVAFSITPLAVNAQVNSNAPQRVSQANRQSPPDLKLSQQQISKITQIRSKTRDQIQAVLTKQQRDKIQSDLQAGKNPQQVFASIQFTQKQQEELRNIMVGSQKQMEGVLDAKQKKILNEWRASQRGQRKK
ncbi:hypothetical protein NIES267_28090 [Calothrix parasitica NIES-267]|uniref:P pilus assembly/Cpx signaling pathway, periplasmic inhibitor/zinc-resistance associated protein n=1 Tax=Calothrix parasitica NIES-267 TaxID=1973488 RepID=A0A1Z4LPZ0_9CYAN|nr:hypothetical protein NIES267_28090 [Calothrix parasitica NIES-267]